jgi:hypothetical protein
LHDAFVTEVLAGDAPVHQLLDTGAVAQLFGAHSRGAARHGYLLWAIFVLSHWAKHYDFHV